MKRILSWLDWLTKRIKDQPDKVDHNILTLSQMSPFTVPAPDPPIHDAILTSRTQAILFRQIVPPNHDPAHLSYFGGLPIAPSDFQWPGEWSRSYSFIMQVDCSAMPAAGRLGMFPDHGVLYVFLDLEWGHEERFSVIWEPGPAQGWSEIAPPVNLPHAYDSKLTWRWPQSDADWPRVLPKWPFDPVLIQGKPLPDETVPDDEEDLDFTYAWPGTIAPEKAIPAIEGAVAQYRPWYQPGQPRKERRPFATFPHDWNAVRITTGLIVERLGRPVSKFWFSELSDEEFAAKLAKAQPGLRYWSDRASAAPAFDEVPPEDRDQFWSWVQEHEWLTWMPMTYAGDLSVDASLSAGPEAAARIPLEVIDYIRNRHALAVDIENKRYVKFSDRMLAPPSSVQDNLDAYVREYILLLELGTNEGVAHHFAEGVYQLWIRPDDLAARRFDRVKLGITAY